MMSISMRSSLIFSPNDCTRNTSVPRIETENRVYSSPDAKVRCSVGARSMPRWCATSAASSGCDRPVTTTMRLRVFCSIPGAIPRSRSRSTVLLLLAIGRFLCGSGLDGRFSGRRTWSIVLDPSLEVPLRSHAHRERSGRDVLAHDRTGTGLRTRPERDGRDHDGVRAGVHMVADDRAVLVDVVVVGRDGARAEVDALADLGVADVRQVRHLAARADRRVLDLDEGSRLRAIGELRPG